MHDTANGWYNLAGYLNGAGEQYHVGNGKRNFPVTAPPDRPWQTTEYRTPTQDECLAIWAEHMRLPLAEAKDAADKIAQQWNNPDMKAAHAAYCKAQRPRWKQEAQACIAKHRLVIFGDTWEQESP